MLIIKHYVIDEDKIHAQIEENKKKPEKAKSKFRQKIDSAMKQAQEQQVQQKKGKKQKAMPLDNLKKPKLNCFGFFWFKVKTNIMSFRNERRINYL